MDIQALNAFNFTIKNDSIVTVPDDDEKILSLTLNDRTIITRGDRVFVEGGGWYLINIIEENGDRYRCMTSKRNNSSMLVTPLFTRSRDLILWSHGLINTFLWHEEHDDDSLFWMFYRYPNSGVEKDRLRFESMKRRFEMDAAYVGEITYSDLYVLFCFRRPDDEMISKDIRMIEKSKYSLISDAGKKKIYDFHDIRQTGSRLQMELEKSSILKKKLEDITGSKILDSYELRSSINIDDETFKRCNFQI